MKRRILLVFIGSLSACTSVSEVSSTQDGHLSVTSSPCWDLISWNHVRKTGVHKAQSYCSQYHKQMHEVTVHSQGLRGVTRQSVQVVFDCI